MHPPIPVGEASRFLLLSKKDLRVTYQTAFYGHRRVPLSKSRRPDLAMIAFVPNDDKSMELLIPPVSPTKPSLSAYTNEASIIRLLPSTHFPAQGLRSESTTINVQTNPRPVAPDSLALYTGWKLSGDLSPF